MDLVKQNVMKARKEAKIGRKVLRRELRLKYNQRRDEVLRNIATNKFKLNVLNDKVEVCEQKLIDWNDFKPQNEPDKAMKISWVERFGEDIKVLKEEIAKIELESSKLLTEQKELEGKLKEIDPETMRLAHLANVKAEAYRKFRAKHPIHGSGKGKGKK